jgi:hypothetical protein
MPITDQPHVAHETVYAITDQLAETIRGRFLVCAEGHSGAPGPTGDLERVHPVEVVHVLPFGKSTLRVSTQLRNTVRRLRPRCSPRWYRRS